MLRPRTIGFIAEYVVTWVVVILTLSHAIAQVVAIPLLFVSASLPWTIPWAIGRRSSARQASDT